MTKRKKNMDYGLGTHISFSIGGFLDNFTGTAYGVRTYAFYETVKQLPTEWTMIAWIFYGIWNMINDPLVGWFSDRNYKWTRKWGKRFPLITIASILFAFSYLPIYFVPTMPVWGNFVWLLLSISLFDFFYSIWQLNYLALIPTKFKKQEERTRIGGLNTAWGILGVVLGLLLPPILMGDDYNYLPGYYLAAAVVSGISILASIAMIPGTRERVRGKLQTEAEIMDSESQEKVPFFKALKHCLGHRNFMMYVGLTLGHAVMTNLMLGSLQYWIDFVLPDGNPDYETFIGAALLIGVLTSVPFWMWMSKKKGNRTAYLIGGFSASAILILFFFLAKTFIMGLVLTLFIGISIGAFWCLMYPGLSDVIDDLTVKAQFHNEGVFTGVRTFFSRLSFVIQALAIGIVHYLTGFREGAVVQIPAAQTGILVHMALIPAIFYLIGTLGILFWYDLTPAKMADIKKQLGQIS